MSEAEASAFLAEERTVTCATVGLEGWPHLMPLWYVPREIPAGEPGQPTPRRARSQWSARNVGHVERLLGEGRMQPAGLTAVERAKADGRWEKAYPGQKAIEVPEDLARALAAEPGAQANFELLSSQNRYAVLFRIHSAKRSDTRARKIDEYVAMLARGETLHPQKRALAK